MLMTVGPVALGQGVRRDGETDERWRTTRGRGVEEAARDFQANLITSPPNGITLPASGLLTSRKGGRDGAREPGPRKEGGGVGTGRGRRRIKGAEKVASHQFYPTAVIRLSGLYLSTENVAKRWSKRQMEGD